MIHRDPYSTKKNSRYLLTLLLAILLPPFHSFGQKAGLAVSSLKEDTLLMKKYLDIDKKNALSSDSSFKLQSAALVLAKKHRLQKKTGVIWGLMAGTNLQRGNFPDCKLYLDSAFRLNERLKDGELICILNSGRAAFYQYTSNYAKAASHYFRALEAVEEYKLGDTRPGVLLYINLAGLMSQFNEDSLARKYLLQAKYHVLRLRPVDSGLLTMIVQDIDVTYLDPYSPATTAYYKDAFKLASKVKDKTYSYQILINLSLSYIRRKELDSCAHYLQLAKQYAEPGMTSVTTEEIEGALAYYKKDYPAAIKHLQTAVDMTQGEDYERLTEIYEAFAEVYADLHQYQKAYEYEKKHLDQYKKKLDDPKKTVADFLLNFQSLEHEKRIMQKQSEITSKEAAIKKRNFWIVAMGVFSALICIILVMAYRNYRHRRVLLNERMNALVQHQEIERLKAEAEGADKERTRIAYDLHDGVMVRLAHVKMNLNALPAMLPAFAEDRRYLDMIEQLDVTTRELRNTAHNLMPEILLEDGLAQAIFYFCKATEQSSGLSIKFQQVGTPLPRLQAQVEIGVYRIVQGLIQNIIRHAKATTSLVQLQYSDYLCAITVEDNGRGISDLKHVEGYGLKSIRNRIKVLNGTFDIESEEGPGTTAYIEFDVRPFL